MSLTKPQVKNAHIFNMSYSSITSDSQVPHLNSLQGKEGKLSLWSSHGISHKSEQVFKLLSEYFIISPNMAILNRQSKGIQYAKCWNKTEFSITHIVDCCAWFAYHYTRRRSLKGIVLSWNTNYNNLVSCWHSQWTRWLPFNRAVFLNAAYITESHTELIKHSFLSKLRFL